MKTKLNFFYYFIFLLSMPYIPSCGQDYNSHSRDIVNRQSNSLLSNCNDAALTQAERRFCLSFNILKDNCFSCHPSWNTFNTEQKWKQSGRVQAGNKLASTVINRLINAGSDMPQGGDALSNEDYELLIEWVENMEP